MFKIQLFILLTELSCLLASFAFIILKDKKKDQI